MDEALELAAGARDIRAVDGDLVRVALDRRPARGAFLRHPELLLGAVPPVGQGSDDLRDHLAGTLHLYPVADPQVLGMDQLFVMQGRELHDHAPDLHGRG